MSFGGDHSTQYRLPGSGRQRSDEMPQTCDGACISSSTRASIMALVTKAHRPGELSSFPPNPIPPISPVVVVLVVVLP